MKHFKKIIFTMVLFVVGALVLTACKPTPKPVDLAAAKEQLAITYATGEDFDKVKTNVTLPTSVEGFEGVTVSWTSDKEAVVSIAGVVVRQDVDTIVTLTAELKAGDQKETKEFKVTVLKKDEPVVVDKTLLKTALDAHYKDTLAVANFLIETESVDLVTTSGDFIVTWTSNNEEVINPTTGVVTRPAYTDGQTIYVILTAKAEGQDDVVYIVTVNQLEQTIEQKLDAELKRLSTFPSSYKPYLTVQDLKLGEKTTVNINGTTVEAVWTSSNEDVITSAGIVKPIDSEVDVPVTLTITVTYEGVTRSMSETLTIQGVVVTDYANFTELVKGENKAKNEDMVRVPGLSFYKETEDGYFLIDAQGYLMFKYGKADKPAAGKTYTVKFEYQLYFSAPQISIPQYVETEYVAPVAPVTTEISVNDLAVQPKPTDDAPLLVQQYKVTGAKLHVFVGGTERYKTFLVPQSHSDATVEPNESDSLMLYYQTPGGLAVLQALASGEKTYSKNFDHIIIVVNAYRSNNVIFAFEFLGDVSNEADLKITLSPAEVAQEALKQAAAKIESRIVSEGKNFTLSTTEAFGGVDHTITYASDKPAVVGNDGVVVAFPAVGATESVVFTLSTVVGEETVTLTKAVKVGRDTPITLDAADLKAAKEEVFFEAYYYVGINNTHQFVQAGSQLGAAVRFARGFDATVLQSGKQYLVYATKASDYNGLHQFDGIEVIALAGTDPIVPVAYSGDYTNNSFAAVMNQLISIGALKVKVAPSKNSSGVLTYTLETLDGSASLAFREHQSNTAAIAAVEALNLVVGDTVKLVSGIVSWYNAPQFINGVLEKTTVTPEQEFAALVTAFKASLPANDIVHYENFSLPLSEDLTVVWAVTVGAEAAAVDGAGLVTITKGAEEVAITLVATITKGELSDTATVTAKVGKEGEVPVATEYHETFNTSTLGKSYGDATFTGVNGVSWSVVHGRNEDTFAIETTGIMLRRADEPSSLTGTFVNGIKTFTFQYRKAFTGDTARKYSVDVTNNGVTTTYVLPEFGSGTGDQPNVYTFTKELNLTGTVVIKIYATGANGNQQMVIDNFKWFEN